MTKQPTVTVLVMTYNQEATVDEALAGVFGQTRPPDEIVISDDASPDGTWAAVEAAVAGYDGPARVVLNRNPENLGLAAHLRKAVALTTGEVVVFQAGDDVSLPGRVEALAPHFDDPRVMAAFSDTHTIDAAGRRLSAAGRKSYPGSETDVVSLAKRGGGVGVGAAYAYRRACFGWPGPFPGHVVSEDRLLPFRAACLGRLVEDPRRLVEYRVAAGVRLAERLVRAVVPQRQPRPRDRPDGQRGSGRKPDLGHHVLPCRRPRPSLAVGPPVERIPRTPRPRRPGAGARAVLRLPPGPPPAPPIGAAWPAGGMRAPDPHRLRMAYRSGGIVRV